MVCIYCSSETRVSNSRPQKRANQIWRRRVCLNCDNVFTTTESADLATSLLVQKNNAHEPFQREKLLLSIYECLRHRKDAVEAATALTATIISQLLSSIDTASISRDEVVAITAQTLKRFDYASSVQYAAFHPL